MNRVVLTIGGAIGALLLAVVVVVVVLVAGGGDEDDGSVSGPTPDETSESDTGERASGELRLVAAEPLTLDPHLTTDVSSARYIVEIFGGLLTLDTNLKIQPDLAAEIPTEENGGKVTNADGTVTYTFHLRENLLFHDRKPVFAEDVEFSLERAADPNTQALLASFFLGDIVGVTEKLRGQANEISGVEVIDSLTIAITIKEDRPTFLFKLTYPTAFVVDRRQVDDRNWTRNPNGTGPYKLDEWLFGQRIVLEANERYHLGAPKIQTVRFLLAGDAIVLYEAGDIDATGVPVSELERVRDPADPLNAEYRGGPDYKDLSVSYIGFNTNAPPFDDPLVRQAFAAAVDLERIVGALLENAIPAANSIVMPGLPAYNPNARAPTFDPERARQLLEQSSYGGPEGLPEISLASTGAGATAGPTTQAILEDWRQHLGIEVVPEQTDAATFFRDVDEGRYQMFLLGWVMDYPDEDDLLNFFFDSESPGNNTAYENPEVDVLLREALTEGDPERRVQLYQQAEQMILDDVPWFPLFFGQNHALVKPYVKNYIIPPAIVPRLRFIELE